MPDPKNRKTEELKEVDTRYADNLKMVLEKHERQNNQPVQEDEFPKNRFTRFNIPEKVENPINMLKPTSPFSKSRCWKGYQPVPGKKAYSKGSCEKI